VTARLGGNVEITGVDLSPDEGKAKTVIAGLRDGTITIYGDYGSEEAARAQCKAEGHDAVEATFEPVISKMVVCRRCGRYARTHEELETMR